MTLGQDVRFAFRSLRRSPVFVAAAVLSLALGIGANTAIFSLIDQTLLRRLRVEKPGELVLIHREGGDWGHVLGPDRFSYPQYRDIRDRNEVFSGVLAYFRTRVALSVQGQGEMAEAALVSGNFFETLGVGAAIGRTLAPEDDRTPGGHPVAVLSHLCWQRRFGSDPAILSRKIAVNGHPMTVIGVAAAGFTGLDAGEAPDVMLPIAMKAQATPTWDDLENRRALWLSLAARRKPGVSPRQAEAALNTLLRPILEMEFEGLPVRSEYVRKRWLSQRILVRPGHKGNSEVPGEARAAMAILMGIAASVLLIACANVANLLLARAAGREREIAIRLALGARRGRIVRQLLVESLMLGLAGGVAGMLVGIWTTGATLRMIPPHIAGTLTADPDGRILLFNFSLALATSLAFGLAPAVRASRPAVAESLKDQGAGAGQGKRHARLRKALVVAQVTLSLVLLAAAGLFARSLHNLKSIHPGFRTGDVLAFAVNPSLSGYDRARAAAYFERLLERLAAIPGVLSAAASDSPLLAGNRSTATIRVEGYRAKEGEDMNPDVAVVSPGLFGTLGIPLAAGCDLSPRDGLGAPRAAVINKAMAQYFFAGENPIGRRFGLGHGTPDIEIMGVVGDIKITELKEKPRRAFFLPYRQSERVGWMTVYVRTAGDPAVLAAAVRREVRNLDPGVPLLAMKTMRGQIDESLLAERVVAILSTAFGLLASVLAAVGLYGVMAYTVAHRTREIGVRMALGAARPDVLGLVLREAAMLAAIGIALALPLTYAAGGLLRAMLWGLAPDDPLTLAGAVLATAMVALAAAAGPALRAARVEPIRALRHE